MVRDPVQHFPEPNVGSGGASCTAKSHAYVRKKPGQVAGRRGQHRGTSMSRVVSPCYFLTFIVFAATLAFSQSDYRVITVSDGGTISGTVKWSGPVPRALDFPVTKDPQICDPDSKKTVDLERLVFGPEGGVANTVVYLKNITSGKAMDLPEQRRHLDQQHCRYIPHILLVPQNGTLT